MVTHRNRVPGQRSLDRHVIDSCGPGTRFAELGHHFGDWLRDGHDAPAATVDEVEPRVAGYLGTAAAAGRQWGLRVGVTVGVVAGILLLCVGLVAR